MDVDIDLAWADIDVQMRPLSASCKMTPHLLKLQSLRMRNPEVLKV
jgi:hypothetical protein